MRTQGRSNRLAIVLVAVSVALLMGEGFVIGQDQPANPVPKGQAAILKGRVTDEAGAPLAGVRVRVANPAADMRFVDATSKHTRVEAKSDADGHYRVEIPGVAERTTVSIDAMKPGYRRLVGTMMAGGDPIKVEVAPGQEAEAKLILKPALYVGGIVVDEQGKPIPGVRVDSYIKFVRATASVERTSTNPAGAFEVFGFPLQPMVRNTEAGEGAIEFVHPDYLDGKVDDVYTLGEGERRELVVVLATGRTLAGSMLDADGKPVAGAMIRAIGQDQTKGTVTDAEGKFTLRGLSKGPINLIARAVPVKQKIQTLVDGIDDRNDLEVRLQPFTVPADLKPQAVLGMQLVDLTPELKAAYDLVPLGGAVILDPGKDSDRLGIGPIAEGNCFFMVGQKRIGGVREFVDQILAETGNHELDQYSVRVVYHFARPEYEASNTQYMKITRDDLKQLQAVADRLAATPR